MTYSLNPVGQPMMTGHLQTLVEKLNSCERLGALSSSTTSFRLVSITDTNKMLVLTTDADISIIMSWLRKSGLLKGRHWTIPPVIVDDNLMD